MNKFFSDHIAVFVLLALGLAVAALIIAARRPRKRLMQPKEKPTTGNADKGGSADGDGANGGNE